MDARIPDVLIVGAGVFGLSSALELRARGHSVVVLDPGPLPQPLAASTDISKVIRLEYGDDDSYLDWMEAARTGWLEWNVEFRDELFHETGIAFLARAPMTPGGFEYESYQRLLRRGHKPERVDAKAIAERFPAWAPEYFTDGFFHARGGYAESGRVMEALVARAQARGVQFRLGRRGTALVMADARCAGVRDEFGWVHRGGSVVLAVGAWTQNLVPELRNELRSTGHPVFHLAPPPGAEFRDHRRFPVFTADISRSGWYGFPLHPRAGVLKIASHGVGLELDAERSAREVTPLDELALRNFLGAALPGLAHAKIVATRRCLYSDSRDGHFLIDRHPRIRNLVVAAGDSGHAFKFAPVLGTFVANAVEFGTIIPRFRWRALPPETRTAEAARATNDRVARN
ncbi:MAG: NAD(P)/FAD-dependent oxidoreductase [Planctomycetota bacterium]